ncbi:MAG: T9SS type A sorting domain-containing protein [Flavobacteriales bacterium]|nr:T9SS type A sorting domain-containing protein [Flavobacteriales bacterium]MBK7247784.1 T9SS type A sorting domain-containing protein [Flavobacteriales bacterium]QQS73055.1 MAG: T9SS type A sorting domain-containing protein [Flavobacteriales bacterium]HRA17568.1 T9SS type A sorting domain-containing protein [Flavobacteriales bacterium]
MMRTLLLATLAAASLNSFAQCIPNALYTDSVYGVWPDTTADFAPGMIGVFYSDTLNLLVPSDAGLIDPLFSGFTVDSVRLDQLSGLPPGVTVGCNSQTGAACTYLSSQVGCGLLEGTPTQVGTFPISIEVTAYLVLFGSTQGIPQTFDGYSITIGDNTTGVENAAPAKLGRVQNVPNPFADRTVIEFGLTKAATAKIKVFNLVGGELWNRTVQAKAGTNRVPFEVNDLESGIYIYHVEAAGATYTGRMMVNR